MKKYVNIKKFDIAALKNIEENEERSEAAGIVESDWERIITKNVHSRIKDLR